MLLKLVTGSTAQARHESWKKRQFEAPHNSEGEKEKPAEEPAKPADVASAVSAEPDKSVR